MVSRSTSHPVGRRPLSPWGAPSRLRRARSAPRRGPVRRRQVGYWLLAALLLPAASVAVLLWLIGPLGYGGAIAVTAVADALVLGSAAPAVESAGAGLRVVLGIVLTVAVTWASLALGFVLLVSTCQGCVS